MRIGKKKYIHINSKSQIFLGPSQQGRKELGMVWQRINHRARLAFLQQQMLGCRSTSPKYQSLGHYMFKATRSYIAWQISLKKNA